jgi:hypothetical protein
MPTNPPEGKFAPFVKATPSRAGPLYDSDRNFTTHVIFFTNAENHSKMANRHVRDLRLRNACGSQAIFPPHSGQRGVPAQTTRSTAGVSTCYVSGFCLILPLLYLHNTKSWCRLTRSRNITLLHQNYCLITHITHKRYDFIIIRAKYTASVCETCIICTSELSLQSHSSCHHRH